MNAHCLTVHRISTALLAVVLLTGCPRVLYLDYRPSASFKGNGPVHVGAFTYAGHPKGLMRQKEVESGEQDPEVLYLSQNIGEFFAGALTKELTSAGYELLPDSSRAVSGTIEEFYLDYVGRHDQVFRIETTFLVANAGATAFTTSCRSERQQVKDWLKSGTLIEQGVRNCIETFLKEAQAAGAL
jgi:uncharacterized lipoprotein YajG